MSPDEIARLAGKPTLEDHEYELWGQNVRSDFYTHNQMAAAIAAEREACARLVDHILKEGGGTYGDAIRAREAK